jgi:release factor glutamine methyltransferase
MHRLYLREIRSLFTSYGYPESDAEDLFMDVLKISYSDLYMQDISLKDPQICLLKQMIDRRINSEPIAYIIGYKEFLGDIFKVTNDTLIPRPETEVLVHALINKIKERDRDDIRILEIGTGTGCIIISMIKILENAGYNNISAIAIDISKPTLEVAKQNAKELGTYDKIEFINCDMRDFVMRDFNVVVSNPPYIPSKDISSLESSVEGYEPHIALDGGIDGLDFYRDIAKYRALLNKHILGIEFGIGQGNAILEIFADYNGKQIIKDLSHIERVMICESSEYF